MNTSNSTSGATGANAPARRWSNVQYGVLPWRRSGRGVQVLLITTRTTRRWIVPKGWPATDMTPQESAAREALEEAGVAGEIAGKIVGTFRHRKLHSGKIIVCHIRLFAMRVTETLPEWQEKESRDFRWCSIQEAIARAEPDLARLILKFARAAARQREKPASDS